MTRFPRATMMLSGKRSVRIDPQLAADITNHAVMARRVLPDEQYNNYLRQIDLVTDMFNHNQGVLNARAIKALDTHLGGEARGLMSSQDHYTSRLGDATADLQDIYRNAIARQNPAIQPRLQQLNQGWQTYKQMELAAAAPGAREGVFSPTQASSAVRAERLNNAAYSRGNVPNQDLADAGNKVLRNVAPDSGTPLGVNTTALIGAILAGEHIHPAVGMAMGAGAAGYSTPGMAIFRALAAGGHGWRQSLGQAVGAAGSPLAAAYARALANPPGF